MPLIYACRCACILGCRYCFVRRISPNNGKYCMPYVTGFEKRGHFMQNAIFLLLFNLPPFQGSGSPRLQTWFISSLGLLLHRSNIRSLSKPLKHILYKYCTTLIVMYRDGSTKMDKVIGHYGMQPAFFYCLHHISVPNGIITKSPKGMIKI